VLTDGGSRIVVHHKRVRDLDAPRVLLFHPQRSTAPGLGATVAAGVVYGRTTRYATAANRRQWKHLEYGTVWKH